MSELVRSLILGVVQGLTEFLPVSSSGHLEIARFVLKDPAVGEQGLLFTIMLHVATALSTLFVFRKDITRMLGGLLHRGWNEDKAFAVNVLISMIPAVIVGFAFEPLVESMFEQRIAFVGAMLCVTAVLLYLADRARQTDRTVTPGRALIVGIAQAVAIIPGISRSGSTIATSVLLGIDRYRASRFSFLMVVPLILGKMAYDLVQGEMQTTEADWGVLAVGFVAAFVTGALACHWMVALIRQSKLRYFSIYCIAIGIFAIILASL
ncbi:MAG: undecaprenyl-diphosphate phosphatase [Saprospiraceae bacterium]|nr:undecaprenyl-diphosphate phosphatase [Saprospiraceae bacterium]